MKKPALEASNAGQSVEKQIVWRGMERVCRGTQTKPSEAGLFGRGGTRERSEKCPFGRYERCGLWPDDGSGEVSAAPLTEQCGDRGMLLRKERAVGTTAPYQLLGAGIAVVDRFAPLRADV